MEPFKINRDSWHYKLNKNFLNENGYSAYYMRDQWESEHNNFCAYWRATMFRLLIAGFMSFGLFGLILMLGSAVLANPMGALIAVASVVGFFGTIIGAIAIVVLLKKRRANRKAAAIPDSLFVQKYKTYKSKICPMVEFEE